MTTSARQHRLRQGLIAAALLAAGAALAHGPPSTELSLSGGLHHPAVYGDAELRALPSATQTVNYTASGVPQTRTYVGTSTWGLLDQAGIVVDTNVHNDVLNRYVLATGTDGYQAVFSLGELHPWFSGRQSLVVYDEIVDGVQQPLGPDDGFARITSPGDVRGGRYVSNLVNLDLRSSDSVYPMGPRVPSTEFLVSGAVQTPTVFDLAALQALPAVTQEIGGVSYTGVSFWDLLNTQVGIDLDASVHNHILSHYVVAVGSDGYKVVFSMGELSPFFGNQPNMIAYMTDGELLGDSHGFARVVAPNDDRRGRWMSNLVALEVYAAAPIPEPGTWLLMLLGLGAVAGRGALSARRRASTAGAAA